MLIIRRPGIFIAASLLTIMVLEEFPTNLIVNERWDRSLTLVYGKSLVIPGLYGTDILLIGSIFLTIFPLLIYQRKVLIHKDTLFSPLVLTGFTIVASALISLFLSPDTATTGSLNTSDTGIDMDSSVAHLVPYFQFKTWLYVYLAYFAARVTIRDKNGLRRFLYFVLIGICLSNWLGIYRFIFYFKQLSPATPIFYDDATLFTFVIFIHFFFVALSKNHLTKNSIVLQSMLVIVSLVIIALSFRRAVWLGCCVCFALTFLHISSKMRKRLLLVGMVSIGISLIYLMIIGWEGFGGMNSGITSTDMKSSAIYRIAVIYNFLTLKHFTLFGYGLKPLWNLPLTLGSFQFNFENIHNLYYWFIMRTGVVGFSAFSFLIVSALSTAWKIRKNAVVKEYSIIADSIFIGIVLFLILGWFHPVYAMARFVIMFGIILGTLMSVKALNDAELNRKKT